MKKNLLLALGLSTSIFAATCNYTVDSSSLEWTAFKTPAKVGVKGSFNNVNLDFKISDSQESLLKSSTLNIVTANVNSNNPGRDAKLVNSFFMVQGVKTIDAKILNVSNNSADVEISMNNIKKVITMNLITNNNTMKLQGEINLADFKMLPSLDAITKACYELHQGKTWQDVALEFNITTRCK